MSSLGKSRLLAVRRLQKDYEDLLRSQAELPYFAAVSTAINKNDKKKQKKYLTPVFN
jgi:hypothetical protein